MRPPVLLFGLPRSGTTWLGKIFDSHPETLYCHEPDSVWRMPVPLLPRGAGTADEQSAVRDWLRRLEEPLPLKSAGKLPLFPKSYYGGLRYQARRGLILGAKILARIGRAPRIPHLVPPGRLDGVRPVWKSIESLGRLGLMHASIEGLRSVHIVRHPCGYVASVLRGEKHARFDDTAPSSNDWGIFEMLLDTPQARLAGLDIEGLKAMHPVERLAWRWVLFNRKAMDDLENQPGVTICVYERLCSDPVGETRRLFAHCDLRWDSQTDGFLSASTRSEESTYYSVFKNPGQSAERWRDEMDEKTQALVMDIALASPPGRLYVDEG